jgi:hypothetical protein
VADLRRLRARVPAGTRLQVIQPNDNFIDTFTITAVRALVLLRSLPDLRHVLCRLPILAEIPRSMCPISCAAATTQHSIYISL